jgi:ribonuclease D
VNSLDPGQRAIARELVEWREGLAERGNRPVSSVLQDATLVEIAKRRPQTSERLSQIRGLHESTLRRRGRDILEAVARGRERDGIPVEGDRPVQPDAADAPLIALAEALVRARAAKAELAYELLATRADLQRIVTAVRSADGTDTAGDADVRTLQGWRREVVGSELLDLLAGRRSLRVGSGLDVQVDG